jgi:hypothetical protein
VNATIDDGSIVAKIPTRIEATIERLLLDTAGHREGVTTEIEAIHRATMKLPALRKERGSPDLRRERSERGIRTETRSPDLPMQR